MNAEDEKTVYMALPLDPLDAAIVEILVDEYTDENLTYASSSVVAGNVDKKRDAMKPYGAVEACRLAALLDDEMCGFLQLGDPGKFGPFSSHAVCRPGVVSTLEKCVICSRRDVPDITTTLPAAKRATAGSASVPKGEGSRPHSATVPSSASGDPLVPSNPLPVNLSGGSSSPLDVSDENDLDILQEVSASRNVIETGVPAVAIEYAKAFVDLGVAAMSGAPALAATAVRWSLRPLARLGWHRAGASESDVKSYRRALEGNQLAVDRFAAEVHLLESCN